MYESRLVGLLGQPEAIFTTAAHALDYQFGFKVSDTWFYRFLEKALGLAGAGATGSFGAFHLFCRLGRAGDEALLECFGKPMGRAGVIGPGLHFKPPWPIGRTYMYHTDRIQTFLVGAEPDRNETIAWTVSHAKEENFLVASRESNMESLPRRFTAEKPSREFSFSQHSGPIPNHKSGQLGLCQ